MKKKILLITMLLFTLLFGKYDVYAYTGSSNMDYTSCIAFADGFKVITNSIGSYEYKYCYRASCQSGVYSKADMTAINGFRCQNGNGTPYRKVTSDGCSKYTGSCNASGVSYCSKVELVDCNRNADGSAFKTATQATTTTRAAVVTTTTRKVTTTARPTTKATTRTTTKGGSSTGNKTTTTKSGSGVTTKTTTTSKTTTKKTNNTNIKKITVNDTDIKYKSSKDTYTIKLPFDLTDVDVKVTVEDETSTVEVVGNTGMPNEDHEIKITVTAVNGNKREVTLKVKRYDNLSNDCTLANIYSEEYNIDFTKSKYAYDLKLPKNVNSVDFDVVASDVDNATVSIEGNEKLKNNSVIKITVRAEDGTTCEYSIKIKKSSNTWKYILAIFLLVGVLVTSSVILYRYLKKSKGKYKYE